MSALTSLLKKLDMSLDQHLTAWRKKLSLIGYFHSTLLKPCSLPHIMIKPRQRFEQSYHIAMTKIDLRKKLERMQSMQND